MDGTRADIGAYGGAIADLDDADSDGWYENYDCDESNTAINPGATEQYYNGVDQNCDQLNDYDADHDGYVATAHNNQAGGSATGTGDCDDNTATTYPTATDAWYDGVDADCANDSDFDQDGDGEDCDGTKVAACSGHTGTDCVDDPAGLTNRLGTTIPGNAINQAATETWYEDVDQDCNGANDYDQDGDGFVAEGYDAFVGTLQVGDCLDQDANAYPGHVDAWYDGKDANCDDKNDYDQDGDGFVATAYNSFAGGTAPDTDDCDDNPTDDSTIQASSIYPGYPTDPAYDGIDQDCDGANDFDADGDGYVATAHNSEAGGTATGTDDCNDNVDAIYPAALEVWYDGTDQDCSNTSDYDQDGDGQDSAADGTGTDCDDDPTDDPTTGVTAAQTYLNAPADAWYDGIDQNCDGASDYDQDADGDDCDGTVVSACAGHTGTDCVDDPAGDGGIAGADIRLGATEVWYDGVDQDCSGTSDYDQDGDGYECDGSVAASPCPGHTGDDCIDEPAGLLSSTGSQINPGAEEVWYDGVDQDCDGNDEDQDGDGYDNVDDCADDNVNVYPGAAEIPYDGEDNDCSGDEDLTDVDGDGFDSDLVSGGTDCDDDDATVNPDATDDSVDGVDQDCDGTDAGTPIDTGGDSDSGMTDSDPVDSDTGTSDDETGCNCSSSSAPMGMLWLGLAAPLMVRRRR
ncbi:MAG: hypothetical protein KC912_23210 [Proteobacteria bacterium]|nr:hypothetical protein [Pseudomonadota bacterium]